MFKLWGITALAVLLSTNFSYAENKSSFSDEELKTLSPFKTETQIKVLKDVVRLLGRDFDGKIELPEILVSEEVTLDQTKIVKVAESQGMPGWAFERGINIFLLDLNIIVLGKKMKLHNLAHEYAHYVQVKYLGYSVDDFSDDFLETQAVYTQNNFRD